MLGQNGSQEQPMPAPAIVIDKAASSDNDRPLLEKDETDISPHIQDPHNDTRPIKATNLSQILAEAEEVSGGPA